MSDERWHGHILTDHGEMAGQLASIQLTLEQPTAVRYDATKPNGESFYRPGVLPAPNDRDLLKVSVRFTLLDHGGPWRGEVITAYPTVVEKQRELEKWRR